MTVRYSVGGWCELKGRETFANHPLTYGASPSFIIHLVSSVSGNWMWSALQVPMITYRFIFFNTMTKSVSLPPPPKNSY